MSDLLLEICSEELPSSAQIIGENQLYQFFLELFSKKKINYSSIETFSTSRRISIVINKISRNEKDNFIEIRGPSTEADNRALIGFLKSNDIKDLRDTIRTIKNSNANTKLLIRVTNIAPFSKPKSLSSCNSKPNKNNKKTIPTPESS